MRRGADVTEERFVEMLRKLSFKELLELADDFMSEEGLTDEKRDAFDSVGRTWAEEKIEQGKHLVAVIVASATCRQETVVEIAQRCLDAHSEPSDVERTLILRELCALSWYLSSE